MAAQLPRHWRKAPDRVENPTMNRHVPFLLMVLVGIVFSLATMLGEKDTHLPPFRDEPMHLRNLYTLDQRVAGNPQGGPWIWRILTVPTDLSYPPLTILVSRPGRDLGGGFRRGALAGNLLLVWIMLLATYGLARDLAKDNILPAEEKRRAGEWEGATAALLVLSSPAIIAYSRLYYQDVPLAATVILGLWCLWRARDLARTGDALLLGLAAAAGMLCKFNWILFLALPLAVVVLRLIGRSLSLPRIRLAGPLLLVGALLLAPAAWELVLNTAPPRGTVKVLVPYLFGLGLLVAFSLAARLLAGSGGKSGKLGWIKESDPVLGAWSRLFLAGVVCWMLAAPWYLANAPGLNLRLENAARFALMEGDPTGLSLPSLAWYALRGLENYWLLPGTLLLVIGLGLVLSSPAWSRRHLLPLLALGGGYLACVLVPNKDLRFGLPLIPLAAVIISGGLWRWRALGRIVLILVLAGELVMIGSGLLFPQEKGVLHQELPNMVSRGIRVGSLSLPLVALSEKVGPPPPLDWLFEQLSPAAAKNRSASFIPEWSDQPVVPVGLIIGRLHMDLVGEGHLNFLALYRHAPVWFLPSDRERFLRAPILVTIMPGVTNLPLGGEIIGNGLFSPAEADAARRWAQGHRPVKAAEQAMDDGTRFEIWIRDPQGEELH